MNFKVKYFLFAFFLALIFLPFIVKTLNLFNEKPLGGAWIPAEKPIFTDSTWFSGEFQQQREKYLNENIGLYKTLVRLNNQLKFSLYKKVNAEKVVVGKKNYLFEENYIFATLGKDFVGEEKLKELVEKFKRAQLILEEYNIKILYVFAPGKATFFREFIPEKYYREGVNPITNYGTLVKLLNENKIDYIDFNKYFLEIKNKSPYPLFPKAGIHWSTYGMYIAADSIIKKVEKDLGKDLPDIMVNEIEISEEQRNPEYDLGDLINILFPIKTYPLGYPKFSYKKENKYRPRVLVVGDSFYWNIYYSGIASNVFNGLDFYYYNSKYYNDGTSNPKSEVGNIEYFKEISKYEYIIILQTDGGLNNFGFGVFDKIINSYSYGEISPGVQKYIDAIKKDAKWLQHIKEKAKQRGKSLDEMILLDAKYMYEQEQKN